MDDWNRLCDYFGLVHGSDIDLMLAQIKDGTLSNIREFETEIEEQEFEIEKLEDKVYDLEQDKIDLQNEVKMYKEENNKLRDILLANNVEFEGNL